MLVQDAVAVVILTKFAVGFEFRNDPLRCIPRAGADLDAHTHVLIVSTYLRVCVCLSVCLSMCANTLL